MVQKLLFERSAGLDAQRAIDGLVRHAHSLVGRVLPLKPSADLLRGPVPRQLAGHRPLQARLLCQLASLWPPRSIPRTPVRLAGSIACEQLMSTHFATYR